MGEVEISINEEALKVVQRYDLRVFLRRLRPKGFERHCVVKRLNCSGESQSVQEFICVLKVFFVIILSFALISLIICELLLTHGRPPSDPSTWDYMFDQTWLFGHFPIGPRGIAVLAMFAAILTVGVLTKKVKKNSGSAPPRRREETVSALVQQV